MYFGASVGLVSVTVGESLWKFEVYYENTLEASCLNNLIIFTSVWHFKCGKIN